MPRPRSGQAAASEIPPFRPYKTAYAPKTSGIKVKTVYRYLKDGSSPGLYTWKSNPYRGTAASGWTRTRADHLGRVVEVSLFSRATKPSASATPTLGTTTTAYEAEYTTVTDPAGKRRRSRLDGLVRLVRVDEPTGSPTSLGTTGRPGWYAQPAISNSQCAQIATPLGTVGLADPRANRWGQSVQGCLEWSSGIPFRKRDTMREVKQADP